MERQPRVRITGHCQERMIQREITEEQVHAVVLNPISNIYDSENNNFKCFSLVNDAPYASEPFLLVIYTRHINENVVITTMWQDKGGLRANGFNNI